MGLLSSIGNAIKNTGQDAQKYLAEWQHKDDAFLIRKASSGTMAERMAAGKILQDRGYGRK